MPRSPYATEIRATLAANGHVGRYDERHIEAYMRCAHSTLDGLSKDAFVQEVELSRQCVEVGGTLEAEALAQSFGL